MKAYQSAANAKVLCQIEPIQGEIGGLALDAKHNLWVSNESVPALSLYSHAANGTQVKPLQVISGDATLLLQVVDESLKGIGIDPLTGDVWVPNVHQSSGGAYLTAYERKWKHCLFPYYDRLRRLGSIGRARRTS